MRDAVLSIRQRRAEAAAQHQNLVAEKRSGFRGKQARKAAIEADRKLVEAKAAAVQGKETGSGNLSSSAPQPKLQCPGGSDEDQQAQLVDSTLPGREGGGGGERGGGGLILADLEEEAQVMLSELYDRMAEAEVEGREGRAIAILSGLGFGRPILFVARGCSHLVAERRVAHEARACDGALC